MSGPPRHTGGGDQAGRFLAEEQNSELIIHGKDGRIREKDSHVSASSQESLLSPGLDWAF
jgi:hypothetical protein